MLNSRYTGLKNYSRIASFTLMLSRGSPLTSMAMCRRKNINYITHVICLTVLNPTSLLEGL